MNKKLLAVAVAGALAAPGVALAEGSSVTISGFIHEGLESFSYGNVASGTRFNKSQMRVSDSASRIYFNSTEDLGNGMSGIMQLDVRVWPNTNAPVGSAVALDGGNSYVGLKSDSWGELTFGRRDMHYMVATIPLDNTVAGAGALQASPTSLIDFIETAPGVNKAVGVGSQLQAVKWQSPNWNGFGLVVAWSADVSGTAADQNASATTARKGEAWNIAPSYKNGPFGLGYSYWKNKPDAPVAGAGSANERSDTLWGYYTANGLKIGLGWNQIELDDATGLGKLVDRDAWTLPISYTWGPHMVAGNYTVARDVDTAGGNVADTGARMWAINYSYSLSKRTTVGVTWAQISNDQFASYNLFTHQFGFAGGGSNAAFAGEDPRLFRLGINHSF